MDVPWPDEHIKRRSILNRKVRGRYVPDLVVAAGLVAAALLILLFLYGHLDFILPKYSQAYVGQMRNPFLQGGDTMYISIILTSPSFSPQSPIDVDAQILIAQPPDSGEAMDFETINSFPHTILFNNTSNCLFASDKYTYKSICEVTLEREDDYDVSIYRAHDTITYPEGGDFTAEITGVGFEEIPDPSVIVPYNFIHISHTDFTGSLYIFKIGSSLTIIATTIGFLNWYQKWRENKLRNH